MANWIQPLELQKIFVNVFAGSPDIFTAIGIMVIAAIASYFRMTVTTIFFMLIMFILIFSEQTTPPLFILFAVIGGLVVGYMMSKFTDR